MFLSKKKKKKKTKERRCNEHALCSIHEPPSAHVLGLGMLLYSFSLMICSQLVTESNLHWHFLGSSFTYEIRREPLQVKTKEK